MSFFVPLWRKRPGNIVRYGKSIILFYSLMQMQIRSILFNFILIHTYKMHLFHDPSMYYSQSVSKKLKVKYVMSTNSHLCVFMPPPLGSGGIMFSGCPSVRPSVRPTPKIPSFDLYMGPLVHPTNRDRFTACPFVRPSVRPSGEVSGHLP